MDRRSVLRLAGGVPAYLALRAAGLGAAPAGSPGARDIIDPSGRHVSLPARIERIGCLTGAAYEKAFLVGAGDKVVVRQATSPPWMAQTNPAIREVPVLLNAHQPNLETLLSLHPDVLFSWDEPILTRKLEENGFTVVCPQPNRQRLASSQAFVSVLKAEVEVYGQVLGPLAAQKASAWSAYLDAVLALVKARTADLRPEQRPATYYVRGPEALDTHGADENISWFGALAGADMLVRRSEARGIARMSMEQIMLWNPEVIFVGRQYAAALVLGDPRWRNIRAVREGRVQVIPDGVFYWDSSSEGVLLLLFMAKALHPGRFADIDLSHEVRSYYQRFYGYPLSEAEARLLLAGRNPLGTRGNPLGN